MKKIKYILSLTLILALALPLFLMPISAVEKEPIIEDLVELTRESEYFLLIFQITYDNLAFYIPNGIHSEDYVDEIQKQKAIEMGYYDPNFDAGDLVFPYSAVDLKTNKVYTDLQMGRGLRFPDTVTVEKVREDVRKYFVSDFLGIIDGAVFNDTGTDALCYLGPDGHVYNHFYGQYPIINEYSGRPDLESAKIKDKSGNKITLSFDAVSEFGTVEDGITIQYTKTNRGWRISGATGRYYKGFAYGPNEIFAPETADNSVVYIALASVSLAALAGVTLVSSNRKKEIIA